MSPQELRGHVLALTLALNRIPWQDGRVQGAQWLAGELVRQGIRVRGVPDELERERLDELAHGSWSIDPSADERASDEREQELRNRLDKAWSIDRSSSGPRDSGAPGLVSPTSPPRLAVRVGVQELDLDPAHPTLPRIDVIGFYLGEARVLRGVSNPRPRPDVAPEGWLVLGAVLVEPCQTLVTAADIRQGHSDAGRGGFFPWRA